MFALKMYDSYIYFICCLETLISLNNFTANKSSKSLKDYYEIKNMIEVVRAFKF